MSGVLVGVDEVGRGCLAGPVWACAYAFLPGTTAIKGLRDSKKLSARARQRLVAPLQEAGHFGHGRVEADEIDRIGIVPATFEAMRRALVQLQHASGLPWSALDVVVDGNVLPRWDDLPLGHLHCQVKADDLVPQVSAASVLAKVARDTLMAQMEADYPGYGFSQHAGYGTPVHLQAIQRLGATSLHRHSFAPLRAQ